MQVGVQVGKLANLPLHADCEHQVDDQLLHNRLSLAERQVVPLQPHHHRVDDAGDLCSDRAENPSHNACRITGTTHSRHLGVVRHDLMKMFCNPEGGKEHGMPTRGRRLGTNRAHFSNERLLPPKV